MDIDEGESFFDTFDYFTGYDPSTLSPLISEKRDFVTDTAQLAGGFIHYVPREQAQQLVCNQITP